MKGKEIEGVIIPMASHMASCADANMTQFGKCSLQTLFKPNRLEPWRVVTAGPDVNARTGLAEASAADESPAFHAVKGASVVEPVTLRPQAWPVDSPPHLRPGQPPGSQGMVVSPHGPTRAAPSAMKGTRARDAAAAATVGAACGVGHTSGRSASSRSSFGGGGKGEQDKGATRGMPQRGPQQVGGKTPGATAEPQLMVVKLLYLLRVPVGGFFGNQVAYLLSLHVGTEAREDVPSQPGRFSTALVQAHSPKVVNPEEDAVRQKICRDLDAIDNEHAAAQQAAQAVVRGQPNAANAVAEAVGPPPPPRSGYECRFNHQVAVRLSEVGPGPAAGGPAYFRVDVWAEQTVGMLGREKKLEPFGRVFVPLTDARYQRRPCTWPVVDSAGKDIAYLTCEFAFCHAPRAVGNLQVENVTTSDVALTWVPPPEDSASPLLGYVVEACALQRLPARPKMALADAQGAASDARSAVGGDGAVSVSGSAGCVSAPLASAWQPVGELPAIAAPGMVAKNLKGNSRYRFRVRALSEAGPGEPVEVEATTSPVAPGPCGRPRLAGCSGPVLTIEWDPPADTGGVAIVSYRIWVRPFSASKADASEWQESTPVKHKEGQAQRAEIRTDELNPTIGRYLCSVAAVNAADGIGPATPDHMALPFPNPCAICGPTPQETPPALANWGMPALSLALGSGRFGSVSSTFVGGSLSGVSSQDHSVPMTFFEPGVKRPMQMPLLPRLMSDEPIVAILDSSGSEHLTVQASHLDDGVDWGSIARNDAAAAAGAALQQLEHQKWQNERLRLQLQGGDDVAFRDPEHALHQPWNPSVPSTATQGSIHAENGGVDDARQSDGCSDGMPQVREQHADVQRRLVEKRNVYEVSLARYKELAAALNDSPEDQFLRRSHEEAEIEAAGYQAEVAVLSQRLAELDSVLRPQGQSASGDVSIFGYRQ